MQVSKEFVKTLSAKIYAEKIARMDNDVEGLDLFGAEEFLAKDAIWLAYYFEQSFEEEFLALENAPELVLVNGKLMDPESFVIEVKNEDHSK
jgi:hypothetical protein